MRPFALALRTARAAGLALGVFAVSWTHAQVLDARLVRAQPCLDAVEAEQALALINARRTQLGAPCARAAVGAPKLVWQTTLAQTAGAQATHLASRDMLTHVGAGARGFEERLAEAGYVMASAGENLAAGQTTAAEVVNAWLSSPTHCKILMSDAHHEIGMACIASPGSRFERFWVAHVGAPRRTTSVAAVKAD